MMMFVLKSFVSQLVMMKLLAQISKRRRVVYERISNRLLFIKNIFRIIRLCTKCASTEREG